MADNWVSPAGHSDPDNAWTDEAETYDDNDSHFAYTSIMGMDTWSKFIWFTHDAINCDKVRFKAGEPIPNNYFDQVDIDVYWDGVWHHIYHGSFMKDLWIDKSLGGTYGVTQAKLCFRNHGVMPSAIRLYEFDFNQIATRSKFDGSLVNSALIGKGNAI
jgi:hypothetical protein